MDENDWKRLEQAVTVTNFRLVLNFLTYLQLGANYQLIGH